jgi:ribonuclease BN (tRNA processing enzyme)
MKIRVLGCAGTVSTESKTSAFLINDRLLLDGGTICSSLSQEEIKCLKNIFISHPHFDHIKGLPSLAETLIFMKETVPVTIHASAIAIDALQHHIMNGIIWPDFSKLPTEKAPVINYRALPEGESVTVDGISVTPWCLYQNQSDFGYLLDDGNTTLLYTSDIGPDAELCINGQVPDSMIIEVSFPDENEELALRSGHLTPLLLLEMLRKLPHRPRKIFISHLKTYFREQIIAQLAALDLPNMVILNDGDILEL